jgi:hypothetical protein
MFDKELFGFISLACATVGYGSYIWSIFKGRTKPHAFSWIVWGTVTAIIFCAQVSKQAGVGAWATGATAIVCFAISILAMWRGEKNITRSDWLTFIGALAGIPLWYFTKDPFWSVILVTVIGELGAYPTFRKSYFKPHEEMAFMYILDIAKYALSLAAIGHYSIVTALYPAIIVLSNSLFVLMLLWRRHVILKAT